MAALVERMRVLLWLFELHGQDVRSDMSVLHRIDRIEDMDAARLAAMAERLHHYHGAVAAAALADVADREPVTPSRQPAAPQPQPHEPGRREVPATAAAVAADPVLSTVISFGRG